MRPRHKAAENVYRWSKQAYSGSRFNEAAA